MRFNLYFNLENERFPIQYRKNILSFIKKSLSEYNQEYFEKLYHQRDNIIKPYTFAVFFKEPKFTKEEIWLSEKKFEMSMSIENSEIAVIFYSAFNRQIHKKFSIDKNSWTLQNITMRIEKPINQEEVNVKFLSPLVVRERVNQKDYYHSYESPKFLEVLKINLQEQLRKTNITKEMIEEIEVIPIQAKKTVIKFYEKQMEVSLGTFKIRADKQLLEYVYKSGVGSRHGSGFGMIEIM